MVRSFFTIYQGRAERAGPGWPPLLDKRRARMALARTRCQFLPIIKRAFQGNVTRPSAACRS